LTVAALPPRVASNDEAVAWNVERVKTRLEGLALNGVKLRVNQNPTILCRVPVLGNPMIFESAGLEVSAEPTSGPRRHALLAQDGAEHRGKMPTDGWHPLLRLARLGERAIA
jgi:hypothetical protein